MTNRKKIEKNLLYHLNKYKEDETDWSFSIGKTVFAISNKALYRLPAGNAAKSFSKDKYYTSSPHRKLGRVIVDNGNWQEVKSFCICTESRIPLDKITECYRERTILYKNYKRKDRSDGYVLENFEHLGYYSLVSECLPFHINLSKPFKRENLNRLSKSWDNLFSVGVEKPKQADLILPYYMDGYSFVGEVRERISHYKKIKFNYDENNDSFVETYGELLGGYHDLYPEEYK